MCRLGWGPRESGRAALAFPGHRQRLRQTQPGRLKIGRVSQSGLHMMFIVICAMFPMLLKIVFIIFEVETQVILITDVDVIHQ